MNVYSPNFHQGDYKYNSFGEIIGINVNKNKVDWDYIQCFQKLDELFIIEFIKELDLMYICCYQKLSISILRKLKNTLNKDEWNMVTRQQNLSEDFIIENSDKLNLQYILRLKNISTDYILAYQKNKSFYNIGRQISSKHVNYNICNELGSVCSARTLENTLLEQVKAYCTGRDLIVKVKIHKNDIIALTFNNILRSSKCTVIEEV